MVNCKECWKETNNPKFCSKSCSASYNNRMVPKIKRKKDYCKYCSKDISYRRVGDNRYTVCEDCRYSHRKNDNCIICNKGLVGRQQVYCSNACKSRNTNRYYQSYELQKQRAIIRKIKYVKILGDKCSVCGYNKNYAVLAFHHVDPTTKKFNLDSRSLSNRKEERCLEELKKCVLLCMNCHGEEHHPQMEREVMLLGPTGFEPVTGRL